MKTEAAKRLLTEGERKRITERIMANQRSISLLTFLLYAGVIVIGAVLWITTSLQLALIMTLLLFHFVFVCVIYSKKQAKFLTETEEIYVTEGIFLGSNKYGHGSFEVVEKGQKKLLFERSALCDKIRRGDKVILIKNKGITLVYLSRGDTADNV